MEMTLAEHAEAWCRETNNIVPTRGTSEWDDMYARWVDFAFSATPDIPICAKKEKSKCRRTT